MTDPNREPTVDEQLERLQRRELESRTRENQERLARAVYRGDYMFLTYNAILQKALQGFFPKRGRR